MSRSDKRVSSMRIRLKTLRPLVSPLLLLVAAAYVEWGTVGFALVAGPQLTPETAVAPFGFPAWLRMTYYVNFLFLILLVRSGLQIPRALPPYWNVRLHPRHRVAPAHTSRSAEQYRKSEPKAT